MKKITKNLFFIFGLIIMYYSYIYMINSHLKTAHNINIFLSLFFSGIIMAFIGSIKN